MVTVILKPQRTKGSNEYTYSMQILFADIPWKMYTENFNTIQTASHTAAGYLEEKFIDPKKIRTVIEDYDKISKTAKDENIKRLEIDGLPYGKFAINTKFLMFTF
jgi:hypothetical protein